MDVYPPLFRPLLKLTRTTFRSILKAYHSHFLIHSCSSDWTYGCSWPFRILFSTTLLLYKLDTLLLKQKNFPVLDITGFFFPHSYSGDDLGAMHSEKRNPCYPIRAAYFVSILLYLILNFPQFIKMLNGNEENSIDINVKIFKLPLLWVTEWLLLNANSAIFQLYHGENKLMFNEMRTRSSLC